MGDSVNLVEEVEKETEAEDKPVVIVASSGTESESTTKADIEESSTEQEIVAAFSPTPATKKRKFNRFSSNRDKIRKRLRQKIKGKKVTIDALSLVRNRQQEEKKKATKNSFLSKGKVNKSEKDKKIDVKKLTSRRKQLFRKRVKPRLNRTKNKVVSIKPSVISATTTSPSSSRTTSRFVPPGSSGTSPLARLQGTGSRARGILSRGNPQAARGLFNNRRPSALSSKPAATVSSVSSKIASSTTSISELQKLQQELQKQQEQLRQIQGSPNQKDDGGGGGGRKDFLNTKKEQSKEVTSGTPQNLRCRFFKRDC